jgi:hypothetical protein
VNHGLSGGRSSETTLDRIPWHQHNISDPRTLWIAKAHMQTSVRHLPSLIELIDYVLFTRRVAKFEEWISHSVWRRALIQQVQSHSLPKFLGLPGKLREREEMT